jgi:hypothetical protein
MVKRFVGAGALVVVSVLGCSSPQPAPDPGESLGASAHAIQGGTLDKTHTYAVGVCGGQPGLCQYTCSGALIAPNLVVTARHCVDDSPAEINCTATKFNGRLFADTGYWITTSDDMHQSTKGWHRATKVVTPTPTAFCGNDLALIILSDVIKDTEAKPITPGIQYPLTNHKIYSTTYTAIGFGLLAPDGTQAGRRYIREDMGVVCIPNDPNGTDCYKDEKGEDVPLMHDVLTPAEFETGAGTCEGDSGSSAYEQLSFSAGKPVSMGVLSRGNSDKKTNTCATGIYTRLDSWRDLIVSTATTAAKLGNYPIPTWTAAAPPEPTDAGVTPGPTPPAPGALGAACKRDSDCDSKKCLGAPGSEGTFTCTRPCDESNLCPNGFSCQAGACFPGAGPDEEVTPTPTAAPTNEAMSTGSSGGCAMGGPLVDPTNPLPWRALGGAAMAGMALLRRRRRPRA